MIRVLLGFAAFVFITPIASPAEDVFTATDMRGWCDNKNSSERIFCMGYLQGIAGALHAATELWSCTPATGETLRLGFLHATRERPRLLTLDLSIAAISALQLEGLCKISAPPKTEG